MFAALEDRIRRLHPDDFAAAGIIAGFSVGAVIVGYVVAMGKPIPIALMLGAIAGLALLNALPLVVWTVIIGVLVVSGPVMMFVPAFEKASWLFSLLGFFLTGAAALYSAVGRNRFTRRLPAFVVMSIVLFVFGLLSLIYSDGPLSEGVRAGKRYYQYFGLMLILAVVPFRPDQVRRLLNFLVLVALVQLPFALYQRFALVPTLRGKSGVYELDIVVGTMEGSLNGGGSSSVMVLLLTWVLAYLLAAHREGLLPLHKLLPLLLLVASPLPLGEVTLMVVLLPLALFAVYADMLLKKPIRFLLGGLIGVSLVGATGWAYLALNLEPGQTVEKMLEAVIAYNFGDTPYFGHGLNRTTVYSYWLQHQGMSNPVALLFGHGLGSSFGGVGEPNPGHMDAEHARMFIGLTAASSILWDLGLSGFLLLIGMLISGAYMAFKLTLQSAEGFDRAFCRTLFAASLMFCVMPFYSNGLISVPSQEVLMALAFGLIAWRLRMAGHSSIVRTRAHVR